MRSSETYATEPSVANPHSAAEHASITHLRLPEQLPIRVRSANAPDFWPASRRAPAGSSQNGELPKSWSARRIRTCPARHRPLPDTPRSKHPEAPGAPRRCARCRARATIASLSFVAVRVVVARGHAYVRLRSGRARAWTDAASDDPRAAPAPFFVVRSGASAIVGLPDLTAACGVERGNAAAERAAFIRRNHRGSFFAGRHRHVTRPLRNATRR
jgi:hypothetical protein